MINPIRKLIVESYEYITPDNLFVIDEKHPITSRDDVVGLYRDRRCLISKFRVHLTSMFTLIEEIEYCNKQLKRILDKENKRRNVSG